MSLFKFKPTPAVSAAPDVFTVDDNRFETLDSLWRQAERLGRVEVDRPVFDSVYRVRIRFERNTGTVVLAEGRNANIAFAVSDAIREAQALGAREQS